MTTPSPNPAIRVLLVDDEPSIRRALRTPLSEMGFQTTEASRGEEALHLVQTQTFDVVLLDVNMPGMGGMKTLTRLRAIAPRLPILLGRAPRAGSGTQRGRAALHRRDPGGANAPRSQ